jgi:glycosyltransferase involved in cell wall biosynthesis
MPTHNSEKWVGETIDNLIAQTYPHFELIVVDDGSRDGTVSLVREKLGTDFKNSWRIIELDTNVGPSAARNRGLQVASGSWVQFLDSDDFMAPTKLELQMAYCAQAPSDVVAVYSPWRQCFVDNGKVSWVGPLVQPSMADRAPIMCLVGNHRPLHSSGLARRSVLDQIGGFDEMLRFWEFEELNFRLAKAGRLECVPALAPLYLWRQHRDKVYIGGDEARYHSSHVALTWIELILRGLDYKSFDQLELSAADRKDILHYSSHWARTLFQHDRGAFRRYVAAARNLDPKLAPAYPRLISAISRHVGYEAAEAMVSLAKAPRDLARRTLQALRPGPRDSAFDEI